MIRVGIIGFGIRGNLYAETLRFNPHAEVAAVAESDPATLEKARQRTAGRLHSDYRAMLEQERLDLVLITLPDHLHRDASVLAAARKCHLLIEKPLATSMKDAVAIRDAVRDSGVKALVAFENRWSPVFLAAKDAIDAGELGEIEQVSGCLNDSIAVPTQMLSWAARTSPAWFLFPHSVDVALWLAGKSIDSVFARGRKRVLAAAGIDTYDSITAMLAFRDGTTGTLTSSWIYPESLPLVYDFRFDIVGSAGAIAIDLRDQMIHKLTQTYTHPATLGRAIHGKPVGFAAEMLNSFVDNVRLGTTPLVELEDALTGVAVIEAVHRSASSGGVEIVERVPPSGPQR